MDNIWALLGLEPTRDGSAIKRAYAQKARTCHPEEDPEGFLRLREAYQAALDYAEGHGAPSPEPSAPEDEAPETAGWTLSGTPDEGPNPFQDHAAIRRFLDLYTGKQRNHSALWLDYFTSSAFLDAAWERRFTALLLEHVTRLETEYPVPREFLNWLCAAYQFQAVRSVYQNPDGSSRTGFQFQIHEEARFDGETSVFEIAVKGPSVKKRKGAERAISDSFREYRRLVRLADAERWNEQDLSEAGKILEFYPLSNLSDKNPCPTERHPAGMRLIEHFFSRDGLPQALYQIAWQKLELKTAVMGRAKLLYGGLRERVLAQAPHAAEDSLDLRQLNKDYDAYRWHAKRLEEQETLADLSKAKTETESFFARPDFQQALQNRRFVEEYLLRYWLNPKIQWGGNCFARRVQTFYETHQDAPCAEQVLRHLQETFRKLECLRLTEEDQNASIPAGRLTLSCRPFLRHWLNTGFYQARDLETGRWLRDFLNQDFPYQPEWSRRFLMAKDGQIVPRTVRTHLDGDGIAVRFHLRYMEFLRNSQPVYRACLDWERVAALTDTDAFFFLLPITAAAYDFYESVKAEVLRRLADTAAPEFIRSTTAACLAEQVCRLPALGESGLSRQEPDEDEPPEAFSLPAESLLPFEQFLEDEEHLYGCEWNERSQTLFLFEQFFIGRQLLKDGQCSGVADAQTAAALSRELLEETLHPPGIPVERLEKLPDMVYSLPDFNAVCRDSGPPSQWSAPVELTGGSVTGEQLEALLEQFFAGRVNRLELSWKTAVFSGGEQACQPVRSLLFMKGNGKYACLCFDDARAESYALLEKPELCGQEAIRFVPFRQGELLSAELHQNPSSIRRRLGDIFQQVSRPGGVKAGGIWSHAVNVAHGRHKYNLDKQLLGGFPMERAHNQPDAPFYFSLYPSSAACVDSGGGVEALTAGSLERPRLQQMLAQFLLGGFPKLRMTWGTQAGQRRHIVLLQDSGRFLLVWLLEEAETAQYHVADVRTYLDVEGKKYPKETFQGRITPAYLIHNGVTPLRNALELLLACIESPAVITGKFAEYAGERPVKPRPYGAIWAELAGDTL